MRNQFEYLNVIVHFEIRDFCVVLGQAEVYLGSLLHEFPPECPAMSGFPAISFGV